ncbi:hypothetical protein SAMN04487963_2246 [Marinobacter zhejiangensis]|uniref:Uncharacterized protein n=1 Tax=Marinobacter zhejiangensis TaxID=488535 RepID=A0A1I4Q9U0_9GAMM|nr:hypothetical protein SAMN04487963_2246 [Marinobacter zhejiangensis]
MVCVPSLAQASATGASFLEVGATWFYFDYQEESDSGQVLNKETGDIPGVFIAWTPTLGSHAWGRLEAGYASHSVEYDGQTQAGVPLTTQTHQRLIHYEARFGGEWRGGELGLRPYLAARYQRWDREIQPTGFSLGLNEDYRWWELGGGIAACTSSLSWASDLCLDLGVFRTTRGEVEVALGNDPDNYPVLEQGDGTGYRVQLQWSPQALPRLLVSLYHAAWDFERSNTELVRVGFAQLRIREPASESSRQGVRVALRF